MCIYYIRPVPIGVGLCLIMKAIRKEFYTCQVITQEGLYPR